MENHKDKVLQLSSPLRHATEQCKILSTDFPNSSVVLLVSDGDHRLKYYSVQVSLLCVFLERNLDMIIAVRICPYQSWQNIAERIMSTLNLGLQNVALARKEMRLIANKSTLGEIRGVITQNPNLQLQLLHRKSSSWPLKLRKRR